MKKTFFMILVFGLALGLFLKAHADTINVDLGHIREIPANSFGASSGQSGIWNEISLGTTNSLLDVEGMVTTVDISVSGDSDTGGAALPPQPTDAQLLLTDNIYSNVSPAWSVQFIGLSDGFYDIYLYAPSNTAVTTGIMTVNGNTIGELSGSADGLLIDGVSYTRVQTTVNEGILSLSGTHVDVTANYAGLAGVQLSPILTPFANAGLDQIVFNEITFDGSESFDPVGTITTYEWQLHYRENPTYDRTAEGVNPTVSDLEPGFYAVILTVTDNNGLTDTDEMELAAIGRKGDLDLDGDVDGDDLSEFSEEYGK